MPCFQRVQALTANQLGDLPLSGWQYETMPYPARVKILQNATTVGVRTVVTTGSQTILQKSPTQGGGTAGVFPNDFNCNAWEFTAAAGDKVIISNDEVLAGTPTVNTVVFVEPL